MTWETVPLGELIAPAPLAKLGDRQGVPILSMTMRDGLVEQSSKFKKRIAGEDLSQYKVVRRGQLVVGFPIDEAVLAFLSSHEEGVVSPAYGVWDVRDDQRLDRSYLERYLRSEHGISYYKAKLRGTTLRRRSLPRSVFEAMPIPLPLSAEQRRIAAILDAAGQHRLKAGARVQRVLTAEARSVESVFASVRAGQRLADVLAVVDGGDSPVCLSRTAEAHEWAVLKLGAVTTGRLLPAENKAVTPDYTPRPALEVKPGDLLMSRKNTLEHVGASVFVESTPPRRLLPDLIFRLVPKDIRITRALQAYLALPGTRRDLSSLAGGSASSMANISRQRLLTLPVPDFTPGLIQRVDQIAGEIGPVLELAATAVQSSDELFASLQHRAFRGEL